MQEIEAKKQLKASEGAHFFYTLIFLAASAIAETQFIDQKCSQNLPLFTHLVFYGLIIWGTYILITLIPRYKNPAINLFFNFLDICFAIYIAFLLIYGYQLYSAGNDCQTDASVLYYFLEVFLVVNGIIFLILGLAFISYILKRFSKQHHNIEHGEEEYLEA